MYDVRNIFRLSSYIVNKSSILHHPSYMASAGYITLQLLYGSFLVFYDEFHHIANGYHAGYPVIINYRQVAYFMIAHHFHAAVYRLVQGNSEQVDGHDLANRSVF